jgi:hypothetical protein
VVAGEARPRGWPPRGRLWLGHLGQELVDAPPQQVDFWPARH